MDKKAQCNLIGVSGKIGSGKDTFAKMIQIALYMRQEGLDRQRQYLQEQLSNNKFNWSSYSERNSNTNWEIKKFANKLKEIVCLLIGCTRAQLEDNDFKNSNLPEMWDRLFWKDGLAIKYTKFPATKFFEEKFPSAQRKSMTVREMLQLVGTDCMRDHLHSQVWVNALFSSYLRPFTMIDASEGGIPSQQIAPSKWIITDVRFTNEAEAIKERNGIMIRMEAGYSSVNTIMSWTKEGRQSIGLLPSINQHESETALDTYPNWDEIITNEGTLSELYEKAKEIVTKYNLK